MQFKGSNAKIHFDGKELGDFSITDWQVTPKTQDLFSELNLPSEFQIVGTWDKKTVIGLVGFPCSCGVCPTQYMFCGFNSPCSFDINYPCGRQLGVDVARDGTVKATVIEVGGADEPIIIGGE